MVEMKRLDDLVYETLQVLSVSPLFGETVLSEFVSHYMVQAISLFCR